MIRIRIIRVTISPFIIITKNLNSSTLVHVKLLANKTIGKMVGVMVLGDSNIKHVFVKEVFEAKLKTKVSFTQTNTKDALEVAIETAPRKGQKLLFHCSWLNEINGRCKGMEEKKEEREKK